MNGSSIIEALQKRILDLLVRYPNELFKSKEMARRLGIKSEKDYQVFKEALRMLQDDNRIRRARGKKFGHHHVPESVTGVIRSNRDGSGTVVLEESGTEVYVAPDLMEGAAHGDTVEVSLFARSTRQQERGARREGEVVRVVKRGRQVVVGVVERVRRIYVVVPDDRRFARQVSIAAEDLLNAREGDKVVVELTAWGRRRLNPEGRVIEVLGPAGEMTAEIRSVVREFNLPAEFPHEVQQEAATFPAGIPAEEIARRLDLRDMVCVTIDPEDAKDFDDAVSLERTDKGAYRLGVHIADVSYYVREGSLLDREALKRGTSVYFPNGVIPMLPERLSNNLCSLRPDEDRLAYSVLMTVTPRGTIEDFDIRETIIRSKRRFSYEEVHEILGTGAARVRSGPVSPEMRAMLHEMHALSQTLTRKRMKEGSIDFDTAEAKFTFDRQGKPTAIIKKVRLDSHRLVEEFMLLANQVVARHIGLAKKEEHPKPFLYRVHDSPDPDRLRELAAFVEKFGFKLNVDAGVSSKALQRLLEAVRGSEVENVINEVALRSMAKAEYSDRNIGHYGLSFEYYSHFTSPIRRYPDLAVHRMLKRYGKGVALADVDALRRQLPYIAKQSSAMERLAMEAERAAVKVVQVEYMRRHVGDEFEAVISGVTHYGIFVELTDLLVEGMVHVRDLGDDYYVYEEKKYALVGRRTGKVYRLGDTVQVKVLRVTPEERQVDFVVAEADSDEEK